MLSTVFSSNCIQRTALMSSTAPPRRCGLSGYAKLASPSPRPAWTPRSTSLHECRHAARLPLQSWRTRALLFAPSTRTSLLFSERTERVDVHTSAASAQCLLLEPPPQALACVHLGCNGSTQARHSCAKIQFIAATINRPLLVSVNASHRNSQRQSARRSRPARVTPLTPAPHKAALMQRG